MPKARWSVARRYGRCRNSLGKTHSRHWRRKHRAAKPIRPYARNGRIVPPTLDFIAQIPSWLPAMKNQPFFTKRHDAFMPSHVSNGPWDPNSMHGRVVVGLLAFVIEQRHGSDDFVPARLTVDIFRRPNVLTPVEVTTKLVRDGLRIKVVEAEFFSGGTSIARASGHLWRRTRNAAGT